MPRLTNERRSSTIKNNKLAYTSPLIVSTDWILRFALSVWIKARFLLIASLLQSVCWELLSPKFQVIRDDYRSLPLKNKTHAHIHKVALKTLYFKFVWQLQNRFLLSRKWKIISLGFSQTVRQLIMRVRKPKAAYKLIQLCWKNPKGESWRISI